MSSLAQANLGLLSVSTEIVHDESAIIGMARTNARNECISLDQSKTPACDEKGLIPESCVIESTIVEC